MGELDATDAVFCGDIHKNLLFVGCGDGNALAYNLDTLECLWGYGAESEGAVEIIKSFEGPNCLISGGDSGTVLKINF